MMGFNLKNIIKLYIGNGDKLRENVGGALMPGWMFNITYIKIGRLSIQTNWLRN